MDKTIIKEGEKFYKKEEVNINSHIENQAVIIAHLEEQLIKAKETLTELETTKG